ncbi:MAG: ATP-binding protein [Bacteroidota bacterium]
MIFKEQAQSKHLQLIVETSGDLPRHVAADDHKLRQILINLIGNAVKFTDHGSVVLRARVDKGDEDGGRLIIEIEDTGPGMSEEELGRLFIMFEQTTAGFNSTRGTGRGLALSRELAILMGGDITVNSEKGRGSLFTINVEIKEGEASTGSISKYENNDGTVHEDIAKLPEELVIQMKHAVETADFSFLKALITSIENDDPELYRHLMAQANDFDYVFLLQVFTKREK